MTIHTRPTPCSKPAFASRAEALQSGELVDGGELGLPEVEGGAQGLPLALTEPLLQIVEEVPFGQGATRGVERRLCELGARAGDALGRAADSYGPHCVGALMHGFALDFAVGLPCRVGDRPYRFVRLHCGPDESGELVATLGLPEELPGGVA